MPSISGRFWGVPRQNTEFQVSYWRHTVSLTEDTAACSRCCIQWTIYTKFRIFNQTYSIWLTALINEYCKHQNIYIHRQIWTLEFVFFKGHNHMFSTRFDSWGTENGLSCVRFDKLLNIPFWPFLARNGSGTPRYRWPCGATAGLSACIFVCRWGYRSGLSSLA